MNKIKENSLKVSLIMLPQRYISQPPLGIAYLASFLRSKGFTVEQRDLSIELFRELPLTKKHIMEREYYHNWINKFFKVIYPEISYKVNEWIEELAFNDSRIIAFSVFSINIELSLYCAKHIKQKNKDKIIVFGGPQVARYADGLEIIKNKFVDYVIPGEGEEVFYELVNCISNNLDVSHVKGVLFKQHDQTIDTGERLLIEALDKLPFPDLSDFPLDYYKDISIPIAGSRGCINKCIFCRQPIFWRTYRVRPGENVYSEIKYQYNVLKMNNFYFAASLINGSIKELEILCDLIIKDKNLHINLDGTAMIRKEMTGELLKKLYNAGIRSISYGIESGSVKVLKDMRKTLDLDLAKKVIKETCEAGIKVGTFWIVGFPTEDESDFLKSIEFIKENRVYMDNVTSGYGCNIFKGTDLFKDHKKYGITFKDDIWYSACVTPEIRDRRLKAFHEECKSMGLKIY